MAITFYSNPRSSGLRVAWALEELGVPHETVTIDLSKGEQKKPEFLAINPNGKVPALVDGDVKMFESLAILYWLGEKYGEAKGLWPKAGTPARAEAYVWTAWSMTELVPTAMQYATHRPDASGPRVLPKEERSPTACAQGKEGWEKLMAVLDAHLARREYILGKDFSLVDTLPAGNIGYAHMMAGLPIEGHANVKAWLARCQGRPTFKKVMAAMAG